MNFSAAADAAAGKANRPNGTGIIAPATVTDVEDDILVLFVGSPAVSFGNIKLNLIFRRWHY